MLRSGHKSLQERLTAAELEALIPRLKATLRARVAELNERQRAFLVHWWTDAKTQAPRAYRSAQAAGYACPRSQGPRLMTMPRVRAALEARTALRRARRALRRLKAQEVQRAERAKWNAWVAQEVAKWRANGGSIPGNPSKKISVLEWLRLQEAF